MPPPPNSKNRLKAFHVFGGDDPGECSYLCFAENHARARSLCYRRDGLEDFDFIEISVRRLAMADPILGRLGITSPTVIDWSDDAGRRELRGLGWSCEGECTCDQCGLHPCDLPEFKICNKCDRCGGCCECRSELETP